MVGSRKSSPLVLLFSSLLLAAGTTMIPVARAFNFLSAQKPRPLFVPKPPRGVPPDDVSILILPGFGNDKIDYELPQAPEGSLVQSLSKRGWKDMRTLNIERSDWLQVFVRGIFDVDFWRGKAPPYKPAFRWYLDLVADTVQDIVNSTDNPQQRIVLVGHSAGGWLARAALGYYNQLYDDDNDEGNDDNNTTTRLLFQTNVCGLVTLGAPHLPPPDTVMDMTRGALKWTDAQFPGAYQYNDNDNNNNLFYVTVIGDAVQGQKQERKYFWEPTTTTGFAYNSYQAVCGDGEAIGDGVVPQVAAHLDGAMQIDLKGIYHSINEPSQWYGSDTVLDSWHDEVLRQLASQKKQPRTSASKAKSLFGMNIAIR